MKTAGSSPCSTSSQNRLLIIRQKERRNGGFCGGGGGSGGVGGNEGLGNSSKKKRKDSLRNQSFKEQKKAVRPIRVAKDLFEEEVSLQQLTVFTPKTKQKRLPYADTHSHSNFTHLLPPKPKLSHQKLLPVNIQPTPSHKNCDCQSQLTRHQHMLQQLRQLFLTQLQKPHYQPQQPRHHHEKKDLVQQLERMKDRPEYNDVCWRLMQVMGFEERLKEIKEIQLKEFQSVSRMMRGMQKGDLLKSCAEISLDLISQLQQFFPIQSFTNLLRQSQQYSLQRITEQDQE